MAEEGSILRDGTRCTYFRPMSIVYKGGENEVTAQVELPKTRYSPEKRFAKIPHAGGARDKVGLREWKSVSWF